MVLGSAMGAPAQVLLRDDFNGTGLDTSTWCIPTGPGSFFGRTQIRPPALPPAVSQGTLKLDLHTHNPTSSPGNPSFWGSEIESRAVLPLATGLAFRARARVQAQGRDASGGAIPLACGLVGSLFSFSDNGCGSLGISTRDEIDIELLSNDVVLVPQPRLLTNVFANEPFAVPGRTQFATVPGLDLRNWNEFEVRWLPGRIQWYVNRVLVREDVVSASSPLPAGPQTIRLNVWAPDAAFVAAYCAALQPVTTANANAIYTYEVDYVEVCRLFDWQLVGTPRGGARIAFEALASASQASDLGIVLVSAGDGAGAGYPWLGATSCPLMLSLDAMLQAWLRVPPPVLAVVLATTPARTTSFPLPLGLPVGLRFFYGGISLRGAQPAAIAATRSFTLM